MTPKKSTSQVKENKNMKEKGRSNKEKRWTPIIMQAIPFFQLILYEINRPNKILLYHKKNDL